jgi:hypothetical protein
MQQADEFRTFSACERLLSSILTSRPLAEQQAIVSTIARKSLAKMAFAKSSATNA